MKKGKGVILLRAIVLSGGGSKGSYEIGVWKALRRLHIKYDIVTGTSAGALNGALMVQKQYHKAVRIWKKLNMQLLFGEDINTKSNKEILRLFEKEFIKNGGINVGKIEDIIEEALNTRRFFESDIDYGLVTLNIKQKKPVFLQKSKMKEEKLASYLMASASCFPAFQLKEIDNDKYMDGGVIDNLPINLAIDLGADEVIAVDLNAPGVKLPVKKKIKITTIKPNNELSFFLNFNEEDARRNMIFGYNDTMKKFGRLDGKRYTFKKNSIAKCERRYKDTYEFHFKRILKTKKLLNQVVNMSLRKKITSPKYMLTLMEELGKMFHLDETKIYNYHVFNDELLKRIEDELDAKEKDATMFKKLLKSKTMVLDTYEKLKKGNLKAIRQNATLAPNEFLKALYLFTISED